MPSSNLTVASPFSVGTFFFKEKSPVITMGSFFGAYNLTLNGPLFLQFLQSFKFYNSYLAYEVVFLHHLRNSTGPKGTPLEYFRLCETFFRKKILTKGSPFNFLIFSDRMDVEKSQRVFQFFSALWDFFLFFFHKSVPNSPIFWHFEDLLLFLSLRYGADLGRSRLVHHNFRDRTIKTYPNIACLDILETVFIRSRF